MRPRDVEEHRRDLGLVRTEERPQPRGRLQPDSGRQGGRLVRRVAEQQGVILTDRVEIIWQQRY